MSDSAPSGKDSPRTPNGEEATEQCPVCGRWNSPGAMDSCEHFFASFWDGEIIGNWEFQDFDEAWSALVSEVWDLRHEDEDAAEVRLRKLAEDHPGPKDWIKETDEETCAAEILSKQFAFQRGPAVTTDGMLSGAGHSLYHENPDEIAEFMERTARFAKEVTKTLSGTRRGNERDS